MQERLLLSSPASAESRFARALRYAALAAGIFVVLWGLADVTSRLATAALGDDALFNAFAPASAVQPPNTVVPEASASTTSLAVFVPARLKMPSLGIDAKVEEVGRKADGSMGTPADFLDVGWWGEGSKPGDDGNAVFDGHVNNALTKAGVFEHLAQAHKGDYVTVSDAEGHTLVYEVSEISLYDTGQAPLAKIFSKTGPSQLVLITCDGEWVQDEHSFDKRLVVVARQVF
jgi:LPXTG-site transpeptidase (sortase) family protein